MGHQSHAFCTPVLTKVHEHTWYLHVVFLSFPRLSRPHTTCERTATSSLPGYVHLTSDVVCLDFYGGDVVSCFLSQICVPLKSASCWRQILMQTLRCPVGTIQSKAAPLIMLSICSLPALRDKLVAYTCVAVLKPPKEVGHRER